MSTQPIVSFTDSDLFLKAYTEGFFEAIERPLNMDSKRWQLVVHHPDIKNPWVMYVPDDGKGLPKMLPIMRANLEKRLKLERTPFG